MDHPVPLPGIPAGSSWDVEFTRLAREVHVRIRALVHELICRFQASGLGCDIQERQTPRGLSTFLALVGQRGLLCMVDMTLVDGMVVAREAGAALDIRLLDASGDSAARCSLHLTDGATGYQATSDRILAMDQVGHCATAVHLLVMGVFGLPTWPSRGSERAVG